MLAALPCHRNTLIIKPPALLFRQPDRETAAALGSIASAATEEQLLKLSEQLLKLSEQLLKFSEQSLQV
ncbi:hypothetical protein E4U26_004717 [Claviceps purpurea]|nr:hypothetical protein E4U26_004717 [Claviceps purpurea]